MSHDRQRKPGSPARSTSIQRRGLDPGRRAPTDALERNRGAESSAQQGETPRQAAGRATLDDVHEDDAWLLLPSTRAAMTSRVQLRAADERDPTTDVHAAAAAGSATPATMLPHRERLEGAFGVDLSDVQAHVGGDAGASAEAMGAEAYATGDHVVLPASPSLHLVAHEVAHVLQQRDGVQLAGGVGEAGDPHERAADAAADAVVRGDAVVGDGHVQDRAAGTASVQRKESEAPARRRRGSEPSADLAFLATVDADRFPTFPADPTIDGAWVTETHVHVVPAAGRPPPLEGDGIEVSWALVDASGEMHDGGRFRWLAGAPTAPAFRIRVTAAGRFSLRLDIIDDEDVRKQIVRPLVVRQGDSARAAATLPRAEAGRAAAAMSNGQIADQAAAVRGGIDAYDRRTGADLSDDVEYHRLRGALSELEWQAHTREASGATIDVEPDAAPEVDGRTFDFSDRGAIRAELERIITLRGIAGAREHIATLSQRSTPADARRTPTALGRFWRPFLDELKLYEQEQAALRGQFEAAARPVALGLLAESEGRIRAELERYGLAAGVSEHVGPERHMKKHGADDRELDGLAAAARRVVAAHTEVTEAQQGQARGERTADDVAAMRAALEATKREALQEHPMLQVLLHGGQHNETPDVFGAATMDGELLSGPIGWELNKKLADIATCRENLGSGKLSVFGIPRVVELAKAQLHIAPGTVRDGFINEEVANAGGGGWTDALLAVFAVGLGLLLAVPTGGGSVVAAGAVTAGELALLATDLYLIGKDLQRYDALRSASNTDLSPVQSLIDEEPSAAGLIVAIATAPVGGRNVLKGVEGAAEAVHRVRALRQAVAAAGGNLADARVVAIGDDLVALASSVVGPERADELRRTVTRGGASGAEPVALDAGPASRAATPRTMEEVRTTNLAREAAGQLGHHSVVAYLRTEEQGRAIMRRIAANDRSLISELNLSIADDVALNTVEWSLGRQSWDGKFLLIHGALDQIDPRALAGVELLSHSHPFGPGAMLRADAAMADGTDVADLLRQPSVDRAEILPSWGDFIFASQQKRQRHDIHTPYVVVGGRRIANPGAGREGLKTVDIVMEQARLVGCWSRNRTFPFYASKIRITGGDEVLWEGIVYVRQEPGGSILPAFYFERPVDLLAETPAVAAQEVTP